MQAKNEAPYLAEWCAYHLALGFDHIWVYDNGSEDQISQAVGPYRDHVDLIAWPRIPAFPESVADCIMRAESGGFDWLALFDADEFIVPVDGNPTLLKQALQRAELDAINEVALPVQYYSSEGHVLIPEGRVVDNYTTPTSLENVKSIVRIRSNPRPVTTHGFGSSALRRLKELSINHYRNKSKEDDLIRRMKGFVDDWGLIHGVKEGFSEYHRARREQHGQAPAEKTNFARSLSVRFGTPGTQRRLGIDPIKVVIFQRNQPNGHCLKEQLASAFRDISLWDVGSDAPTVGADATFANDGYSTQINRAHSRAGNSAVLWLLYGDIYLNNNAVRYREAIVSAFPFGVWSPQLRGKHRKDQTIPDGKLCSVRFVEGIAWAVSAHARKLGFPLPDGAPIGWGQDLRLSRKCLESGMRNLIDGRVSVSHVHESNYVTYDRKEAERQMIQLLAREFPDGLTFGGSPQMRSLRNVLKFV